VVAFKEQMARLEAGLAAGATSSGRAAQFLAFAALTGGGDPHATAITGGTNLVFVEALSNPSCEVADLAGLAEVAHAAGP